ncbi:MAG: sulfatase-like hydrolase/transferase [Caldimonas sp.]
MPTRLLFSREPRSPRTVVVWLALWLALVGNLALWRELWRIGGGSSAFFVALGVGFFVFTATVALLALTAWGRWWKAVWIAILVAAGVAQHFMLTYGVVMDTSMLANTMQTDPREVRDLLGWAFAGNLLLVVALPAVLVLAVPVARTPWWPQLWKNAALFVGALAATLVSMFAMYGPVAPLVRNNMHLRYIVNPIGGLTSAAWIAIGPLLRKSDRLMPIAAGVALGPSYAAQDRIPLLVIVVGETARADHFALNGYPRDTTPELAALDVLSFHDVRSCGTDTRDSVPCMFSPLAKPAFENRDAEYENLLDLLQAAGLAVLWLDNQAGCKEVCARVPTASTSDLKGAAAAGLCGDGECFDDAMLVGLDERIAKLPEERRKRGIVLVMHQMGSHGPAYYKRSPPSLKRFMPECTNTTLSRCDPAQLVNAYDNTIATTDHFLAATIAWLKGKNGFASGLLYMSDHGESLGELGLFLHGLPYKIAPEVQKRVPFVAWFGEDLKARRGLDLACLRGRLDVPLSHDNLYHSVVGLLDVATPTYQRALDAFAPCRQKP